MSSAGWYVLISCTLLLLPVFCWLVWWAFSESAEYGGGWAALWAALGVILILGYAWAGSLGWIS